jgi:wyosine [tRNA(Phe)-imidazoG37] synthetase (radical SAM superfamily)
MNSISIPKVIVYICGMDKFVFGPVPSRRLGFSLGVDIIPRKYCNFDCVYCQIGKTTRQGATRRKFFKTDTIVKEIVNTIQRAEKVDFVTFSGSGEPTLNQNLGAVIQEVKRIAKTPVAVITNSSLLNLSEVRNDLINADVVLPSLDAASGEMFKRINRPQGNIGIMEIIDGIKSFRNNYAGSIWLEIMLIKGMNDTKDELQKLSDIVNDLNVDKIHLNTISRPPSEKDASRLDQRELERIRKFFGNTCEVISSFEKEGFHQKQEGWGEMLVDILKRRSLTLHDIIKVTGVQSSQIKTELQNMENNGLIKTYRLGEEIYYISVDE